jgi:hypothetical protein
MARSRYGIHTMKTIPKTTFPSLENPHWHMDINPHTGAIARITHPEDPHGMNWISDSAENPTFLDSHGWGLGFLAMPGCNGPQRWQQPEEVALEENGSRSRYLVGTIEVTVSRHLHGDRFDETFEFRNIGSVARPLARRQGRSSVEALPCLCARQTPKA